MAINPMQYHTMQATIGAVPVTCCMHDGSYHPDYGFWYATAQGGAICLQLFNAPEDGVLKQLGLKDVLHLADAHAVAQHVTQVTLQYLPLRLQRSLMLDPVVEALTVLSLYPGYFAPDDADELRSLVIHAFVDAISKAGVRSAWHMFTRFVFYLVVVYGMTPFHDHLLRYLPRTVAGALVANGLSHLHVWGQRHATALEWGWQHQLAHPDQEYVIPLATDGDIYLRPLIDQVNPETLGRLLAVTGLCMADVARARTVGTALAGGDTSLYTRSVLASLSAVSRTTIGLFDECLDLPPDFSA